MKTEKETNLERYPTCFETFFDKASEQWSSRIFCYTSIAQEMESRGTPLFTDGKATVAEMACGTGDMAALLSEHLKQAGYEVEYHATDRNKTHTEWTKARLDEVGVKNTVNPVYDTFTGDPDQLRGHLGMTASQSPDMSFAEHSLYGLLGKPDALGSVLMNMGKMTKPNGMFCSVMAHESDNNRFHGDFSGVHQEPSDIIHAAADKQGLPLFDIPLKATMEFPRLNDEEWSKIRSGEYDFNHTGNNQQVKEAVHLMEFWGRPLEFMKEDGTLPTYVDRVRDIVEKQNYVLSIGANMMVMPSADSTPEFVENLAASVKSVNQQLAGEAPIPVITRPREKLLRVLPDLGREAS